MANNIFVRMKDAIAADLHQMVDEKESKNPIAMLNQYLRESEKEVEKMRSLLERQYLINDKFTSEIAHTEEMANKRREQAEIALKADEFNLHKFAYAEQIQYEDRLLRLKEAKMEAEKQIDEMEQKYALMNHKLKDMKLKRMELMSRENIARANFRANKLLNETADMNQPYSKFSEMEGYIDRIEHQVNSAYYRNTIDAKIAQLEKQMEDNQGETAVEK